MIRTLILLLLVLLVSTLKGVSQFLHKDKLVAYYPLDGNGKDESGNLQHGIITRGVTPVADRKGREGKAMLFNGTDGMIQITETKKLDYLPNQFSFTAWVNIKKWDQSVFWPLAGTDKVAPIFCKSYQTQDFQYRWGCTDKGFYMDGNVTTEVPNVLQKKGISLNKWTFIAACFDGNYARYYVDGSMIAEVFNPYRYELDDNNLVIGCDYPGAPFALDYFNGSMDELRIYKKSLFAKEVYALFKEDFTENIFVKGNVFDKKTGNKIPAFLTLKSSSNGELKSECNEQKEFEFKLTSNEKVYIKIAVLGYLKFSDSISLDSVTDNIFRKNFYLQPIIVGEGIVLKNILFVKSKTELLPESYPELDKLVRTMKDNPSLEIELGGHTDNIGSIELNQKLSEQRAQAVKNYLISRGIQAFRVSGVGYGGTHPLSTVNSEQDKKLNRRVEFKILKF